MQKQREGLRREMKKIPGTFFAKILALLVGGFGLVAALAWNDAVQALVIHFLGPNSASGNLIAKFIYALIVTAILVLASIRVGQEEERKEENAARK